MSLIEWDSSFSVGVELMDDDHKRLVAILNRLFDAWQDGAAAAVLGDLIDELVDYAAGHFEREETLMDKAGYSGLPQHRLAHNELKAAVVAFRKAYLSGGEPAKLTAEMGRFLRDWLLNHILGEDMHYKLVVTRRLPD